jgi:hypothetical protein
VRNIALTFRLIAIQEHGDGDINGAYTFQGCLADLMKEERECEGVLEFQRVLTIENMTCFSKAMGCINTCPL